MMANTFKTACKVGYWAAFLSVCIASLPCRVDSAEALESPRPQQARQDEAKGKLATTPGQLNAPKNDAGRQNKSFRDCPSCPEMIKIPGDSFMMGSPSGEEGADGDEHPPHEVKVENFAIGKYEVTRSQFAAFVKESGYDAGSSCFTYSEGSAGKGSGKSCQKPAFHQGERSALIGFRGDV
ncbi:MAG: formylglycine-generating enzyme family protein, partial [Candidatus Methylumidiphilus sp.]